MTKRKMANTNEPNNSATNNVSKTNKRQKVNNLSGPARRQQATKKQLAANQQQVNSNQGQRPENEPVWIYGLINNIEQMLSQFNAANNNQRLQQVVQQQQQQQQQQIVSSAPRATAKASRAGAKSRASNNSSGYSTPSSLYSTASLSPPFSNSSTTTTTTTNCAYSSSSSSNSPISATGIQGQAARPPNNQTKQAMIATAASTAAAPAPTKAQSCRTSQQSVQQQQQQQLPRSPLSRQIKFHEYKGPPQTRRPSNQKQQQQQQQITNTSTGASQEAPAKIESANIELPAQHQMRAGLPINSSCQQFGYAGSSQSDVFAPNTASSQSAQGKLSAAVCQGFPTEPQKNNGRLVMGPEQFDRSGQAMIVGQQAPSSFQAADDYRVLNQQSFTFSTAPAANTIGANQPRASHLSIRLIRRPNGQQQQVLVVDPVAFQQMQQQHQQQQQQMQQQQLTQFSNQYSDQKQKNIIVLRHEPVIAEQANNEYNALLNNSQNDNIFQMNQATSQTGAFIGGSQQADGAHLGGDNLRFLTANQELYEQSQPAPRTVRLQTGQEQSFGGCPPGPTNEGTNMSSALFAADNIYANQNEGHQPVALQAGPQQDIYSSYSAGPLQGHQKELFGVDPIGLGAGVDEEDDTCEIEPTISFEGELDHRMMYSEFIDSQDIPLNVDESDWLKKFLPPCSSS